MPRPAVTHPGLERERRARLRRIALWLAAVTGAHFTLGTGTPALHGWHVALASAYLLPVVDAAVGFGLRGGLLAAGGAMAAYAAHLAISWSGRPGANPDQLGMLVVFPFVGAAAGLLVREADRRRLERDVLVRQALRGEMLQGALALVAALGARSPEARRHAERVSRLGEALARELGLDGDERFEVSMAGLVHDVGQVAARDEAPPSGHVPGGAEPRRRVEQRSTLDLVRALPGSGTIAAILESLHAADAHDVASAAPPVHPGARIVHVAHLYVQLLDGHALPDPLAPQDALARLRPFVGMTLDRDAFQALEAVVARGSCP